MIKFWENLDHILDTKKNNMNFLKSCFQCIFTDFGLLIDITPKIMHESS